MSTLADPRGCGIGAYVNGLENLSAFQERIEKKLAAVLWYSHWQAPFPTEETRKVLENHSLPLITWEPWITHPKGTLAAIAAGECDQYIRSFLQAAKAIRSPLLLRFAHEMNGNWYPWDGLHNGERTGPDKYQQAWEHIYNIRKELRAENIKFVWCPNNCSLPKADWNNIAEYYPGDQYVDWIGMDGYNWGYGDWQSFDALFQNCYRSLTALTEKPLLIGEFAAAEGGGDKAAWITDAFAKIERQYPRIKLFCWFNINKERDWRINSCAASESAFKNALQSNYFLDRIS